MKFAGGKIQKKYGIEDVDVELRDSIRTWSEALGGGHFQGGGEPNLADVSVYGILKGLEEVGGDWFEVVKGEEDVWAWYKRMEGIIGEIS
ncbi:hypothetical protein TrST_g1129 [Triparma strigata]|uniref:GST C-terminal domain-containing protein n=1 Tax=Triparma strigata TaxID=1606541 RepID=A0A9W7AKB2_9STRA|nr:hypothetical protein TrST_g1129 [Triparma strigata]